MCNTADNAQTFPQFPLSLHACFAEVRKHFWLYTIFTWGPTEQHKSLLPFLEEPTALVKPSSSLCCHKKVPSFWMQSAAVQRLCCGLGKKSALMYLPGRSSQGCWAEAGTSSSGEGHLWAERLPETLCFGFSSSETARLRNWSAAQCKDWKEQSVSAGKIKKSKHLRLHFLLHFQDTLLEDMKAGHPANKDRNETPTGTSQLGREKSPATELPEIGQRLDTSASWGRLPAKRSAANRPQLHTRNKVSTWQGLQLEQGVEPGWACQEMWHFHMRRQYPPLLYIPFRLRHSCTKSSEHSLGFPIPSSFPRARESSSPSQAVDATLKRKAPNLLLL